MAHFPPGVLSRYGHLLSAAVWAGALGRDGDVDKVTRRHRWSRSFRGTSCVRGSPSRLGRAPGGPAVAVLRSPRQNLVGGDHGKPGDPRGHEQAGEFENDEKNIHHGDRSHSRPLLVDGAGGSSHFRQPRPSRSTCPLLRAKKAPTHAPRGPHSHRRVRDSERRRRRWSDS